MEKKNGIVDKTSALFGSGAVVATVMTIGTFVDRPSFGGESFFVFSALYLACCRALRRSLVVRVSLQRVKTTGPS